MNDNSFRPDGLVHLHWPRHELTNAISHFVGFLLALAAVPVLIVMVSLNGNLTELITFTLYSATLILLYLVSTLYHAWPPGRTKRALQKLDHMMVYVLIAGTYTPFLLAELGGAIGWSLFLVLWTLAAVGIGMKAVYGNRHDFVSTIAYLVMGWTGLVAIVPLYEALPKASFLLVLAGGIAYTIGTVFYRLETIPFNHTIWHLVVLVASGLHFAAVFSLLD